MRNPSKKAESRTRLLVLSAMFAALTAVCAQVTIPIGAVPVSLSLLPVLLCGALLPPRYAALSMGAYLLMGLAGVPVFSGLGAGPGKLFGVTGGYLIGYLPCAWLTAFLLRQEKPWWHQALAMAAGVLSCYAFGTAWFMATKQMALLPSLSVCVFPFLPFDALKIALAILLVRLVGERLKGLR
ncbi:MAG: biotin transporter BioY [Clostridia bacterium]|nr:biotin transporter BioY [Clostridia bacterium]